MYRFFFIAGMSALFAACASNSPVGTTELSEVKAVDSFWIKPTERNQNVTYAVFSADTILGTNMAAQSMSVFVRKVDTFFVQEIIPLPKFPVKDQLCYLRLADGSVAVFYGENKKIVFLDPQFKIKDTVSLVYDFGSQLDNQYFISHYGTGQAKQLNDSILCVPLSLHPKSIIEGDLNQTNLLFLNLFTKEVSYRNIHRYYPEVKKRTYWGYLSPFISYDDSLINFYYLGHRNIFQYNYSSGAYDSIPMENKYYKPFEDSYYTVGGEDTVDVDRKLWLENYFNKVLLSRGGTFVMLFMPEAATKKEKENTYGIVFNKAGNTEKYFKLDKPSSGLLYFVDSNYIYSYHQEVSLNELAPNKYYKHSINDFFK